MPIKVEMWATEDGRTFKTKSLAEDHEVDIALEKYVEGLRQEFISSDIEVMKAFLIEHKNQIRSIILGEDANVFPEQRQNIR